WVRLARPGEPADALTERYGGRWYHKALHLDTADRVKTASSGAQSPEFLVGGESKVTLHYSERGTVKQVTSSYGTLVSEVHRAADGLHEHITYGDLAATTTQFNYDTRRRLSTVQTYRGPPALWTTPSGSYTPPAGSPSTLQLVLQNDHFSYDVVGNPTQISDLRNPDEWPAGAKPVTRQMQYDDLYRLTRQDIGYTAVDGQPADQDDAWIDPHEGLPDPRRAEAAPRQSFPERARYQTWAYDWLGNLTDSGDDADGFYDRSLGAAEHGPVSGRAYQLQRADNRATGSPRQGALRTSYDLTGNLTELRVDRDGPCIPAGHCAQVYRYAWDEVGRLVTARRWDAASLDVEDTAAPAGPAAVELHYGYDANDQRVSKRAVDPAGEQSFTLYIFDSLELRRTAYLPLEEDYALNAETEVVYLLAGSARLARLAYEAPGSVPSSGGETVHVFLELGDHLGSTNTVLDLATSELVEKSTHYAYGGIESDYRPTRWNSFREDYKFTGKEEDIEVGLVYFGKRFYAPALQRWASPDPLTVHGLGADPNLYAYVSGQVLKSVDPLGLERCKPSPDGKMTLCEATQSLTANYLRTLYPVIGTTERVFQGAGATAEAVAKRDPLKAAHEMWSAMEDTAMVGTGGVKALWNAGVSHVKDLDTKAKIITGQSDDIVRDGVSVANKATNDLVFVVSVVAIPIPKGSAAPKGGSGSWLATKEPKTPNPPPTKVDTTPTPLSKAPPSVASGSVPAGATAGGKDTTKLTGKGGRAGGGTLSTAAQRSIRSLEARLAEHERKLAAYIENPFAFDNRGDLARNAGRPEVQQRIIDGRIRHLEGEIRNFQQQIEQLHSGKVDP
ncbi:MAG: RHS repeat-associated core domain-containing protein, partial [Polyangiaceae bacterium]|nr:RHS repeat-associated core domain-containing protein [Polyangiaceae bacterium]